MKDYQQKRMKEYVLPQPVYRQALWAVKDLSRLREKMAEMRINAYVLGERNFSPTLSKSDTCRVCDVTGIRAVDIAALSQRISAIENAFYEIPEKYREGIMEKLVYDVPYSDCFHPNTWKKWQQILLYKVAVNLNIL